MSYTLELPPELDAQLHSAASRLQQGEMEILLAAVRQYLSGMEAVPKDPIAEEWLDYGEEMLRGLP